MGRAGERENAIYIRLRIGRRAGEELEQGGPKASQLVFKNHVPHKRDEHNVFCAIGCNIGEAGDLLDAVENDPP